MRRVLSAIVVCALALAAPILPVTAQPLDDPIPRPISRGNVQVRLEPLATGLTAPNWGISAPGDSDRLFVVDQDGILWAIDLASGAKSVFLDVSARLVPLGAFGPGTFDERGFLGLAFHPNYATNGLLYTFTTEPVSGPADFSTMPAGTPANSQSVIAEWQVPNPKKPASVVDPTSRRELVRIDKPQFNHNGGALNFGPDGFLYVSLGDGGGADDEGVGHSPQGNGQDPSNVLGKILRIDPAGTNSANGNYGIPGDNPFVGEAGFVPEIWAYGFRNPFRFSFDTATGALFAGDVGQNDIEEVDVVSKGGNFGWRVKEGSFLFDPNGDEPGFVTERSPGEPEGLIDPVAEYDHDEGISVIGGFVYRGDAIPQLKGSYVFGDFARSFTEFGRLFFFRQSGFSQIQEFRLVGQDSLGLKLDGFGQDANGELYVLGNTTGTPFEDTGVVLRIAPRQRDNELEADLNGFAEVDPATGQFGAGDLNGDGLAEIRLRPNQVCFKLEWADIDQPVAAHIHSGVVGANGSIVVDLLSNADHFRHEDGQGSADGCTEGVGSELINDIGNHPGAYYVNIHTTRFPGGAIRGNLERDEVGI